MRDGLAGRMAHLYGGTVDEAELILFTSVANACYPEADQGGVPILLPRIPTPAVRKVTEQVVDRGVGNLDDLFQAIWGYSVRDYVHVWMTRHGSRPGLTPEPVAPTPSPQTAAWPKHNPDQVAEVMFTTMLPPGYDQWAQALANMINRAEALGRSPADMTPEGERATHQMIATMIDAVLICEPDWPRDYAEQVVRARVSRLQSYGYTHPMEMTSSPAENGPHRTVCARASRDLNVAAIKGRCLRRVDI